MRIVALIFLWTWVVDATAQRYVVDSSFVKFYSKAPVEDIEAFNNNSNSIIDLENGHMAFSIPIKDFQFDKALMQEHFNENYLESKKYPKATFSAQVVDWKPFFGKKNVEVVGKLNIHGVEKRATMNGTIDLEGEAVIIDAMFYVDLVDYKINIPKAVFYNIAETIEVTVHFEYKPFKK